VTNKAADACILCSDLNLSTGLVDSGKCKCKANSTWANDTCSCNIGYIEDGAFCKRICGDLTLPNYWKIDDV